MAKIYFSDIFGLHPWFLKMLQEMFLKWVSYVNETFRQTQGQGLVARWRRGRTFSPSPNLWVGKGLVELGRLNWSMANDSVNQSMQWHLQKNSFLVPFLLFSFSKSFHTWETRMHPHVTRPGPRLPEGRSSFAQNLTLCVSSSGCWLTSFIISFNKLVNVHVSLSFVSCSSK